MLEVRVAMDTGGEGCEPTGSSRKASESGSARGSAASSRADSEERLALLDPIAARLLSLSYCRIASPKALTIEIFTSTM